MFYDFYVFLAPLILLCNVRNINAPEESVLYIVSCGSSWLACVTTRVTCGSSVAGSQLVGDYLQPHLTTSVVVLSARSAVQLTAFAR